MGYRQAGFDVVGVDLKAQPRYPFAFLQMDVLKLDPRFIATFDAIHASPPCQASTRMKTMHNAKAHVDLIPQTRAMLKRSGLPWVIENVVGAALERPILLCGTMFDLGAGDMELQRHRLFEANFQVNTPDCEHTYRETIGVYGGHVRNRSRRAGSKDRGVDDPTFSDACTAMGVNWMNLGELCQAIPPAYADHIGRNLIAHIVRERIAA